MYKIEKNKFIQKVVFSMFWFLFTFLISLGYFLGFEVTLNSLIIYMISISVASLLFFLIYKVFRKFNKGYYEFSEKKITEYSKGIIVKEIMINKINSMFYIRSFWMIFMQIGACFLNIEYGERETREMIHISMSKKDINKISKIINNRIIIK